MCSASADAITPTSQVNSPTLATSAVIVVATPVHRRYRFFIAVVRYDAARRLSGDSTQLFAYDVEQIFPIPALPKVLGQAG
jgi:hypothetical protein